MRSNPLKIGVIIAIIAIIIVGILVLLRKDKEVPKIIEEVKIVNPVTKTIGSSVQGRKIESFTYGTGSKKLVFVGGIHGGYEWNGVFLAYQFMDYLDQNLNTIPKDLSVIVIPNINPDGVFLVTGKEGRFAINDVSTSSTVLASGRFNANQVDLNRNFDCKWQPKSTWQKKTVSAGSSAFSEPEAKSFQDFILENKPDAVVFWHSQANAVYASQCKDGIIPETLDLMNVYSKASKYKAVDSFDAYEVTGAADDWLASINIPAITVELQSHSTVEWKRNLEGIKAVLGYYENKSVAK